MFSIDALDVRTSDGRNFISLIDFSFQRLNGEIIMVPAGSSSDGASTPCALWPTIPPFGKYWMAAFLHDYLYRCTTRPKVECDAIFKEAMISLGVVSFEADIIYEGVNLCGQYSFNTDRKGDS